MEPRAQRASMHSSRRRCLRTSPPPTSLPPRFRRTTCAYSERSPYRSRCSCSRERVENALRIAGAAEIESILAERGDVEVTCEFCNRRYAFEPAEARALFVPESAGIRH